MYLWECAVMLGRDELEDAGPANTETGLHREPVFASQKGGLGLGAVKVEEVGLLG